MLSSAAVDVTATPPICNDVVFICPLFPYITALLLTTVAAEEPSNKLSSLAVEVIPLRIFISDAVAVSPVSLFNSAVVVFNPTNLFISTADALIETPSICNLLAFICPALPYITALLFTTVLDEEPSNKLSSVEDAVTPSRIFISSLVAVTPSRIFNSAAVEVTPSRIFNSAALAVTSTPPSLRPLLPS